MKLLTLLIPILFSLSAQAGPKVIYFGGATAVKSVLDGCFPNFENHGYPAGGDVAGVINEINAHPDQEYIVAGHSSGARYIKLIGAGQGKLKIKDPSKVTMVSIDGFSPFGVPKNFKRICWNAKGGTSGKLLSRNYGSAGEGRNCSESHTYEDSHCNSVWCMHFSLVNANAPADLRGGYYRNGIKDRDHYVPGNWASYQPKGGAAVPGAYRNCSGTPPWLQQ